MLVLTFRISTRHQVKLEVVLAVGIEGVFAATVSFILTVGVLLLHTLVDTQECDELLRVLLYGPQWFLLEALLIRSNRPFRTPLWTSTVTSWPLLAHAFSGVSRKAINSVGNDIAPGIPDQ
jgi:hypothetical protein